MARENKRRSHVLKEVNQCSNTTLTKRATNIGKHMLAEFNENVPKFYNLKDVPVLENLNFSIKDHTFNINYGDEGKAKKKQKSESMVRVLDEGNISRDPY